MDSIDKMVVGSITALSLVVVGVLYVDLKKTEAEMMFKYAAAANGAPVVVCVK